MPASPSCPSELLKTALTMEEKGRAFYDQARKDCQNPECREIFTILMRDEILHQDRIRKIFAELSRGPCWDLGLEKVEVRSNALDEIFRRLRKKREEALKPEAGDLEALDAGLTLEEESAAFYQRQKEQAKDPQEVAFWDRMIQEERGHFRALQDIRYYLTDPAGWFIEKEKAGLDGA